MSVCLMGSLEDFSIQDLLQIISFGHKTGCLSLETDATGGSVVFRKGRVLASVDDGCLPLEEELRMMHGYERDEVLRRRITASLDRFARSRAGDFSFLASPQPPRVIAGRDISPETLDTGIEVVEILLELAGPPAPAGGEPEAPDDALLDLV